ncbi:hypothetical protein AYI70_g9932, partial [Smittium culicis]
MDQENNNESNKNEQTNNENPPEVQDFIDFGAIENDQNFNNFDINSALDLFSASNGFNFMNSNLSATDDFTNQLLDGSKLSIDPNSENVLDNDLGFNLVNTIETKDSDQLYSLFQTQSIDESILKNTNDEHNTQEITTIQANPTLIQKSNSLEEENSNHLDQVNISNLNPITNIPVQINPGHPDAPLQNPDINEENNLSVPTIIEQNSIESKGDTDQSLAASNDTEYLEANSIPQATGTDDSLAIVTENLETNEDTDILQENNTVNTPLFSDPDYPLSGTENFFGSDSLDENSEPEVDGFEGLANTKNADTITPEVPLQQLDPNSLTILSSKSTTPNNSNFVESVVIQDVSAENNISKPGFVEPVITNSIDISMADADTSNSLDTNMTSPNPKSEISGVLLGDTQSSEIFATELKASPSHDENGMEIDEDFDPVISNSTSEDPSLSIPELPLRDMDIDGKEKDQNNYDEITPVINIENPIESDLPKTRNDNLSERNLGIFSQGMAIFYSSIIPTLVDIISV